MGRKRKKGKIVKVVSMSTMYGNSYLEQWLNMYLTKNFIAKQDIPNDECLSEARDILEKFSTYTGMEELF